MTSRFASFRRDAGCGRYVDYDDFHHHFEGKLLRFKGGLLVLLVLVSLIYQVKYAHVQGARTLLNSATGKGRVFGDAALAAFLGTMSAVFVMWSRHGSGAMLTLGSLKTYALVAVVLGLFVFAQESSGFNRWLDAGNIAAGKGIYYELDATHDATTVNPAQSLDAGGNPFLVSLSYFALGVTVLAAVYYGYGMFQSTACGYRSGRNNVRDTGLLNGRVPGWPIAAFVVELLVIAALNSVEPLSGPSIRGQARTGASWMMAGATAAVAILLQCMFQYSGTLGGFKGESKTEAGAPAD